MKRELKERVFIIEVGTSFSTCRILDAMLLNRLSKFSTVQKDSIVQKVEFKQYANLLMSLHLIVLLSHLRSSL